MIRYNKSKYLIFSLILFTTVSVIAAKPIVLKGTKTACVVMNYNFDTQEEDFPNLNVPDNALLLLKGQGGACEPMAINVTQNGEIYKAAGSESFYLYAAFHIVYFDPGFDKFKPFKLSGRHEGENCEIDIKTEDVKTLAAGAQKVGDKTYFDPITNDIIRNSDPMELAELLSRGRFAEFSNYALDLTNAGGLPRVRREARTAFDSGEWPRAACMAAFALSWSPTFETADVRKISMFQDWVLTARSFRKMNRPIAATMCYDQALKLINDPDIVNENKSTENDYIAATKSVEPSRPDLSEAELESGQHGAVPIPESEGEVIEGGKKANGVFLGDHKDRVKAQCGVPTDEFSGVLLYLDHPICPEAIFFSPNNRAYLIRTHAGKTSDGLTVNIGIDDVIKKLGNPDKQESIKDETGKQVGTRYIYLDKKISFSDYTGDNRIDAIDVFDYGFIN